ELVGDASPWGAGRVSFLRDPGHFFHPFPGPDSDPALSFSSSVTAAAAAPVRGRGSMSLDHCPICLGSWEEASFVMPCLHRFCYPCILRWAESKPECPLCKRRILSILHSVRADDDYMEVSCHRPSLLQQIQHRRAPRHLI
uniref:E3 ubiquitin-protein ligase Topors n=1 Tax=Buteo japonicus TaxID=224669 RepID=A0A8B9Z1T2_9AVES